MVVLLYRLIVEFAVRQRAKGQSSLLMMLICFEGHIACSSSTKSELVIPCFNKGGRLLGVLDIDSDQPHFFTWQDADQLDQTATPAFSKCIFIALHAASFGLAFQLSKHKLTAGQLLCGGGDAADAACQI